MTDQRDSRSWLSVGFAWASRITTLALEFAVPVLIGVGLDRGLGTRPGGTIAGAILGFVLFMVHTLRMAKNPVVATGDAVSRRGGEPSPPSDEKA